MNSSRPASPHDPQLGTHLKLLRLSGILETLDARLRQAVDGQWFNLELLECLLEEEVEGGC